MKLKIKEDFIVERISHPDSVVLNLKGLTIKDVIELHNSDFCLGFEEKVKDLETLNDEVWFSKEFHGEEFNRMRNILKEGEKND